MRGLLNRTRIWVLSVAAGGGMFLLGGCDPAVRDTVLNGVGSAATGLASTFINAFIQSLSADEEETATTVQLFMENATDIFA